MLHRPWKNSVQSSCGCLNFQITFYTLKMEKRPAAVARSGQPLKRREGYFEWDKFFMTTALVAAQRSKDPVSQVGACIVNNEMRIVGVGYNDIADGCNDDEFPWGTGRQPCVCHAEMNAIQNKYSADIRGCTMYTTRFPCSECAKMIIQSGIKKVVYVYEKILLPDDDSPEKYKHLHVSRQMMGAAGVALRQYIPASPKIEMDYAKLDPEAGIDSLFQNYS